jgi:hypothetical protein
VFAKSVTRVQEHTAPDVNARIREKTQRSIALQVARGGDAIDARLEELDREWDIERVLEAVSASAGLLSVILGLTKNRKWFAVSTFIAGGMLAHALQGWFPGLAAVRRLGFRTPEEIAQERYALKALRGDFKDTPTAVGKGGEPVAQQALDAARK